MPRLALILPAAGQSTRFGGQANKLMAQLADVPVLAHSLEAFLARRDVVAIMIPTRLGLEDPEKLPPRLAQALADPRVKLCAGGTSRADSVRLALAQAPGDSEWIAVHDAARPLVSQALIDRILAAAQTHGAAAPAMAVTLTIKEAQGPLPAMVQRTLPRDTLWAMQTPQVMRRADLQAAFDRCPLPLDQITDDAQLLELAGMPVFLVEGESRNIKITTPDDLRLAEMLLAQHPAGMIGRR